MVVELIRGRTAQAVLLIIVGIVLYLLTKTAANKKFKVSKIEGIDAIENAVKKAAELGRPVFFCPGLGTIGNADTLAAIAILDKVAGMCARYEATMLVATGSFDVQQVAEETVRRNYRAAGKESLYRPEFVRYIAAGQWAFAAGAIGVLAREKPAVNLFFGDFSAEALQLSEAGRSIAQFQFGGTTNPDQLPAFVATCDYALISAELYAAEAFLENDPQKIAQLVGEDAGKFVAIALIAAGAILSTLGNSVVLALLRL